MGVLVDGVKGVVDGAKGVIDKGNGEFRGTVKATIQDHDRRLQKLEDKIDDLSSSITWKLAFWFFGYLIVQAGTVWIMLTQIAYKLP